MALIECPDCGRKVSDAAPACPQCGRPIATLAGPAEVSSDGPLARKAEPHVQASAVEEREDQPGTWRCQNCGAVGAFRKFSIIYEEGTHSINTSTAGGVSGGGVGVGVAGGETHGSQQSDLARRVAPPAQRSAQNDKQLQRVNTIGCLVVVVLFPLTWAVFTVEAAIIVLMVTILTVALWASTETTKANADLPARKAVWERKFLCTRCGYERERLPSLDR